MIPVIDSVAGEMGDGWWWWGGRMVVGGDGAWRVVMMVMGWRMRGDGRRAGGRTYPTLPAVRSVVVVVVYHANQRREEETQPVYGDVGVTT